MDTSSGNSRSKTLFNFNRPDAAEGWYAVNDAVMGGISRGKALWSDRGCLIFEGVVSFENGGGFSSIRSADGIYDLRGFTGIKVSAAGDGKTYKFTLRTEDGLDTVTYQQQFTTVAGETREYLLPLTHFQATYHGKPQPDEVLRLEEVRSFGCIIADRQEGPFHLELLAISLIGGDS